MEKPVKVSVFLPPDLHKVVKVAAIEAGQSLSQLIAAMITKKYKKVA